MGKPAHNFVDLTGQVFDRLLVKERLPNKGKRVYWLCECQCEDKRILEVESSKLKTRHTRSCGCLRRETTSHLRRTHGRSGTRLWGIWRNIKKRCLDPKCEYYHLYGGRGIAIYEPWINDFAAFADHVGQPPSPTHSIDRINNELGYIPGNLRWATPKEQGRNKRNNARYTLPHPSTHELEDRCLSDWCEVFQKPYYLVKDRLRLGWAIQDALSKPKGYRPSRIN